ncbi:MAG: hypothetical protein KDB03_18820 [Planctomycetales bacterium]|nr:hypothetical protein [Planctomycetales bacterium]
MNLITYQSLFAYLRNLGFSDISKSNYERVFEHRELGILLAVSMLDNPSEDRVARDADILSAQFQLQQHGLLEGKLVDDAAQHAHEL